MNPRRGQPNRPPVPPDFELESDDELPAPLPAPAPPRRARRHHSPRATPPANDNSVVLATLTLVLYLLAYPVGLLMNIAFMFTQKRNGCFLALLFVFFLLPLGLIVGVVTDVLPGSEFMKEVVSAYSEDVRDQRAEQQAEAETVAHEIANALKRYRVQNHGMLPGIETGPAIRQADKLGLRASLFDLQFHHPQDFNITEINEAEGLFRIDVQSSKDGMSRTRYQLWNTSRGELGTESSTQ